ncbi:MAG: toll/interleukin-1 receptor domain-containing protein [Nitrospira sp.]|nr:toll/interleukin-1 receptor domain-containing protein [Nitrospira sp.]
MKEDKRDLIFISHATPEDNAFTLWLSTRLKLIGYQVWSDVTQLFGGEKWWDDIEQAIDQFTCKFILVITRTSLSKPGVQREVELALGAEKNHQLSRFIVPVIIDDSGFGGQPYDLSERNIVDFSEGWAAGLGKVIERFSRDNVPTSRVEDNLGQKLAALSDPPFQLKMHESWVLSNWLNILSLPKQLNFYRLPVDASKWKQLFGGCIFPWFEWGGMFVTFATSKDLMQFLPRHFLVREEPHLELIAVLEKRPRNHPGFLRGELIKRMNYLLSEAWHSHMRSLGLHRYELSSGKVSWFFPDMEDNRGKKAFADIFGVLRKKQVIGYSPKNAVHWHFAIEPKAQYGPHPKFCLVPHVVFTEDGRTPLADKDKMHRLRRGFCKSWWNDRWRDLLLGYMELVTQGKPTLDIYLGNEQLLSCHSRPQIIHSEYSLINTTQKGVVSTEDEVVDIEVSEE